MKQSTKTKRMSWLYPPSQDEQIVNCALIIFLNALTIHFGIDSNWTLHRKAFKAVFDDASFEARIDGYLKHRGSPRVIIEVKPASRDTKELSIQMHESTQVVAWIKSDADKGNHGKRLRLHLAQDRHEIYLTIAEYDGEYVKYLEDKDCRSLDRKHIQKVGPLLLAISLWAGSEIWEH